MPADVAVLADTLRLLHMQMQALAGMASAAERETLDKLMEGTTVMS